MFLPLQSSGLVSEVIGYSHAGAARAYKTSWLTDHRVTRSSPWTPAESGSTPVSSQSILWRNRSCITKYVICIYYIDTQRWYTNEYDHALWGLQQRLESSHNKQVSYRIAVPEDKHQHWCYYRHVKILTSLEFEYLLFICVHENVCVLDQDQCFDHFASLQEVGEGYGVLSCQMAKLAETTSQLLKQQHGGRTQTQGQACYITTESNKQNTVTIHKFNKMCNEWNDRLHTTGQKGAQDLALQLTEGAVEFPLRRSQFMDCSYEAHRVLIGHGQTCQSSPKHFTHIANLNKGHKTAKHKHYNECDYLPVYYTLTYHGYFLAKWCIQVHLKQLIYILL